MKPSESSAVPSSSADLAQEGHRTSRIAATASIAEAGSGPGIWEAVRVLMSLQQKAPPLRAVPDPEREARVLSSSEERLWRLWQMQPDSSGMNIPFCFRIEGDLNLAALERSLEQLMCRHDVLRTSYPQQNGEPVRAVAPPGSDRLSVEVEDADGNTVGRRIEQEACRPFDLERGPLLRVKAFRLGAQEHLLSIALHHIIFDGWSEGILFRELASFYNASVGGEAAAPKPLAIAYRDYARWQREYLQGELKAALLQYWQAQFKDGLRAQQAPLEPKPSTSLTRRSGRQAFNISADSTQALKAFSRREGATLFAALLAGFKVLLYRYTEQERLFVCTPIATRNRNELKGVIGYFINLLILETDLSGEPSFREVLQRVRQVVSGAYAHQDLPFQQTVRELGLSRAPLAQVMFALQNYPQAELSLEGLAVERLDADNGVADFDLFLSLTEAGGELHGELKYNADLYEAAEAERLVARYLRLLENIPSRGEAKISSLDLLNLERRQPRPLATPESGAAIAPRNDLERQLQTIWERELGRQPIGVADNFFEAGGNSMIALQIFNEIRARFGKDLPLSALFQCGTIERLAAALAEDKPEQPWSSLVEIQPLGRKTPIFCMHPVRGNVLCYRRLSDRLGLEQPFYGLQAQGLDGKQPPLNRIEKMAAKYIREIRTVQPHGPYRLAGYSLGGMVAFEMAQQLQAQGQQVDLLALFDTYGHRSIAKMKRFNTLSLDRKVRLHWNNAVKLHPKKQLAYFFEKIRQRIQKLSIRFYLRSGLELPASLRLKAIQDRGLEAAHAYVPKPYPGRLVLFRATKVDAEPTLGWDGLAAGGIEIYDVPGKHNTIEAEGMLTEPHVGVLAEKLKACLESSLSECLNRRGAR
jgi:thioesterase domain-containing protein/acyl carrier protein